MADIYSQDLAEIGKAIEVFTELKDVSNISFGDVMVYASNGEALGSIVLESGDVILFRTA